MKRFVQALLENRALVIGLLAAYLVAGYAAIRRLPIEAYPDVTNVEAQVITLWPGHAAEEVEKFVTIPIENQINSVPKLADLRSISLFGLSQVTAVFDDDADNTASRTQVNEQLSQVTLPTGASASLSPDSTAVSEIYRYTLQAPAGYPLTELKALEDWVVERQFRTVPGVVDVSGFGGPTKQYQVLVDPLKLKSYQITLKQVTDALSASNQNAGGAYVERGSQMFIVRGLGLIANLEDIRSTVLAVRNNTPITVGDLGEVRIGNQLRLGRVGMNRPQAGVPLARTDQDDVVEGTVLARRGANALDVLKLVEAKADQINKNYLPPEVRLVPYYDRTELIHRTLHTVTHNMVEGILLVLAVLVTFLGMGNWRSALIVASVIPFALLGAFMLLDYEHIPANLISMGAIDFGIIVDSAVVIIENIIHLLEGRRENGLTVQGAIVEGTRQMAKPILFSKVILLTAFLPLYTMQRVEGRIFRPMALTLTFAIVAGTVLAIVAVPCFASFFLHGRPDDPEEKAPAPASQGEQRMGFGLVTFLRRYYIPLLDWALPRRALVIGISLLALAVAIFIGSRLGSEFLPKLEEGSLWVRITMPESISPSDAARITRQSREILASFPESLLTVSQLGRPDDGTDVNGFNTAEISVPLKPQDEWTTAPDRISLCEKMKEKFDQIPGIDVDFSQYIEDNVNEAISGIKSELAIKVFGPDADVLQDIADQIVNRIQNVPGVLHVTPEHLAGQPQVQIRVNRPAVARYGLYIGDVDTLVENAFGGIVATQVLEGEESFDLSVKLRPDSIANLESIRSVPLLGANGELVTLGSVSEVGVHNGFGRIFRENSERRIAVKLSVGDRDLGSLVADAQARAAGVKLPPGYRTEWTGSFENERRAQARLAIVVPITLACIFFLLFTAFHSGRLALLILLNVPLAAIGGIAGLAVAGLPTSVSALVGFVALFGASVQNGVILLERIRELQAEGRDVLHAVREGAISRLRPVLMTSGMAALGLLPAALSHAAGAETARPFAVVIVGGLISSTILTLIVLPVVSAMFLRGAPLPGKPSDGQTSSAAGGESHAPVLTPAH
jgi:cobalt-zinc-cadmium resistance protein CzcA